MCSSREGRQCGKLVSPGPKAGEDVWLAARRLALGFWFVIRVDGRFWFRGMAL